MPTAAVIPLPVFHAHTADGDLAAGYLLYTYAAGTTTPLATYTDHLLTPGLEHQNPIELNARGEAIIYVSATSYKFVLKTPQGVTVWTADNIVAAATAADLEGLLGDVESLLEIPDLNGLCQGRITLTASTPVTTADVTGATTVRFTPYKGNTISLYDGADWVQRTFTELTLALGSDSANLMYDLFAYDNGGTVALERTAWTNTTTRATGLTTQDGVLVRSGAATRRYLGSYRTTGTVGTTEDSAAKRYVWNYYHRVRKHLYVADATATYNYTTATFRQANAAAANQVEAAIGIAESMIELAVNSAIANTNADVAVAVSIGEDSTTTPVSGVQAGTTRSQVANILVPLQCMLRRFPAIGSHTWVWLEKSAATGTTTWTGTSGDQISGMVGSIDC